MYPFTRHMQPQQQRTLSSQPFQWTPFAAALMQNFMQPRMGQMFQPQQQNPEMVTQQQMQQARAMYQKRQPTLGSKTGPMF